MMVHEKVGIAQWFSTFLHQVRSTTIMLKHRGETPLSTTRGGLKYHQWYIPQLENHTIMGKMQDKFQSQKKLHFLYDIDKIHREIHMKISFLSRDVSSTNCLLN